MIVSFCDTYFLFLCVFSLTYVLDTKMIGRYHLLVVVHMTLDTLKDFSGTRSATTRKGMQSPVEHIQK